MNTGWLLGVTTAVMLLCFLGVVIWAWSGRRKSSFERAARLPLEDDAATLDREVRS
jgi:cytochrome c oxidase cbb3-type subunit IV